MGSMAAWTFISVMLQNCMTMVTQGMWFKHPMIDEEVRRIGDAFVNDAGLGEQIMVRNHVNIKSYFVE